MICSICGGQVEWRGKLSALTHTECLDCGETNCQEINEAPNEVFLDSESSDEVKHDSIVLTI